MMRSNRTPLLLLVLLSTVSLLYGQPTMPDFKLTTTAAACPNLADMLKAVKDNLATVENYLSDTLAKAVENANNAKEVTQKACGIKSTSFIQVEHHSSLHQARQEVVNTALGSLYAILVKDLVQTDAYKSSLDSTINKLKTTLENEIKTAKTDVNKACDNVLVALDGYIKSLTTLGDKIANDILEDKGTLGARIISLNTLTTDCNKAVAAAKGKKYMMM